MSLQVTLPREIGRICLYQSAMPTSRPIALNSEKGRGPKVLSGRTTRCPPPRSASSMSLRPMVSNQSRVKPPASNPLSPEKVTDIERAMTTGAAPMQRRLCCRAFSRCTVNCNFMGMVWPPLLNTSSRASFSEAIFVAALLATSDIPTRLFPDPVSEVVSDLLKLARKLRNWEANPPKSICNGAALATTCSSFGSTLAVASREMTSKPKRLTKPGQKHLKQLQQQHIRRNNTKHG
eukprot:CAMPEP_0115390516 /NCGR_PEP_ID=MMETSP0271-20121206/10241_1 /TAXON_ID=71861 /ORGANISM="Scrippsiella trochoidea, Strain CCMP3099" /LENGTH=234 /DNA_ID=CAMNT_0002814059 /DNA_START=706 /DNA_END=1406 /DNA_ORIENTATION=+